MQALLKQFQGYAKDLSAAEDPTDVVRKSTSTVPYLGIPVGKEALPTDLAGLVDSMSVGQTIGPKESKQDNSLNIVKLVAKQQLLIPFSSVLFRLAVLPQMTLIKELTLSIKLCQLEQTLLPSLRNMVRKVLNNG